MADTKRAKPCLSKRSGGHIIPLLGTRETLPPSAGSLLGNQKAGTPLVVDDDKALPWASGLESSLGKYCTCVLVSILGQVKHGEKKKHIFGQKQINAQKNRPI